MQNSVKADSAFSIKQIEKQSQAGRLTVQETMVLAKWSAIQYFPRDDIAALYQQSFKDFLVAQLPIKHQQAFIKLANECFENIYKEGFEHSVNEPFTQAILLWVKQALPPKTKRVKVNLNSSSATNTIAKSVTNTKTIIKNESEQESKSKQIPDFTLAHEQASNTSPIESSSVEKKS